ncbi:hypothetical protein Nepgr_007619 [Nepenthes gracilis]|uniref:Calponin-homology (CH) domain-containing protein n=1 Tax=Nepenthes gracilis TaxID=150966 RepID=A0AAD3S7J7_NEPGR|nr:hypothetical protein Nepgr_007619 [Nepenthes gracilis]
MISLISQKTVFYFVCLSMPLAAQWLTLAPRIWLKADLILVLGLISQIIKIQLLADLNLKKTSQLLELADDSDDIEELMNLSPEKILLKWMNFHLKKGGYKKTLTNFSSDLKDGEAYAYLLNLLAPEHCSPATLDAKDPFERVESLGSLGQGVSGIS